MSIKFVVLALLSVALLATSPVVLVTSQEYIHIYLAIILSLPHKIYSTISASRPKHSLFKSLKLHHRISIKSKKCWESQESKNKESVLS